MKNGFEVLDERKAWTVKPNGKYIVTRNGSSFVLSPSAASLTLRHQEPFVWALTRTRPVQN